jgi:hypothetical protein|tara:strand:- start:386 stop:604 length:219 start_codon:yes stop_codon:yes gene_type:complete
MVNAASIKSLGQVALLKRQTEKVLAELDLGDARSLCYTAKMLEGRHRVESAVPQARTCSYSETREKLGKWLR